MAWVVPTGIGKDRTNFFSAFQRFKHRILRLVLFLATTVLEIIKRLSTEVAVEQHNAPLDDYGLASKMLALWLCLERHPVNNHPLPFELRDMILRQVPLIYMHRHDIRRTDKRLPDPWENKSTFVLSRPIWAFNFGNFFVQQAGLCIRCTLRDVSVTETGQLLPTSCIRYYRCANGEVSREIWGYWRQFEDLLQPELEHLETHYIPLARWLHIHWLELQQ